MFVAASTQCYPDMPLSETIEKLAHLEFSHIELALHESGNHLKPSDVLNNFDHAIEVCMETQRLVVSGLDLRIEAEGEEYFATFTKICELAKLAKIISLTVRASEHGTPFNEEVERYKRLVKIADVHGVRVAMRTEVGRLSGDVDTVSVICGHVKGVGLAIDPSHYHFGNPEPPNYEKLMPYVHNVYLRDSTPDQLQVRVGQGIIDYGRLINLLRKEKFRRTLCVDIQPQADIDHDGELRKLRLLRESLVLI